jgi:Holliday junction resolvase RusA-like endonuclease
MFEEIEMFSFGDNLEKDTSPHDNTQITSTMLYFSSDELKEYKKIAKNLLKKHFPENYMDSNISDLILKIFRDEDNKTR